MRATAFLVAFLFVFGAVPTHGEGVSVLAGMQTVSFSADLERGKYYDLPAGPGLALNIGIPSFLGVPFDINVGLRSMKEGNSGDDADYQWIEFGPRFPFGKEGSRVRPELFAGGGLYDLKIGDTEFNTGTGFYAGVGVQDFASENVLGRFQVKGVYWKSDTGNTDAASLNFSLMYGYQF